MMKFNALQATTTADGLVRKPGMTRNSAGGFGYQVDDWKMLERFITLGTTGGTFYISEKKLAEVNVDAVNRCLDADPVRAIRLVEEIAREGRAPRKDPGLFVLALATARLQTRVISREGAPSREIQEPSVACREALAALPSVARPFTDLSHFITYVTKPKLRGWGSGMMRGVARWYNEMPVDRLALQVIKYQQRDGVTHRDAYDLAHPARWQQPDAVRRAIFDFIVDGRMPQGALAEHRALRPLLAFARVREDGVTAEEAARLVTEFGLPIEAVPNNIKTGPVYAAVLDGVLRGQGGNSLTWVVRNLGNLAKHEVLSESRQEIVEAVCGILRNEGALQSARIHPVSVLKAMLTYSQGHGEKGNGEWPVLSHVVDALDAGFYKSFRYVPSSGKRLMLGIDVSGSMWQSQMTGGFVSLSTHQAAGVMALAVAHAEPNSQFVKFDDRARPINISTRQRLDDVVRAIGEEKGHSTDLASPVAYALKKRIPVDAFVNFSDYETWRGNYHSEDLLAQYRRDMGIPAKVVNVAMTPNRETVSPPGDPGVLELVGFDTVVPQAISAFLKE
jgi:60 kDa SS-A/Ro ribonucleoprotein